MSLKVAVGYVKNNMMLLTIFVSFYYMAFGGYDVHDDLVGWLILQCSILELKQ